MANCGAASCDGVDAASLKWFKISEEGFVGGSWAGEKISKTLKWDFTIPSDIASG
jgi:cellulase